ncbi:MAG: prolyl oligopeptidase family serine peptidase [Bacteroidales bacterium]
MLILAIVLFLSGCKDKYINYPYAENNSVTESFYNHTVIDDYKWLEIDEEKNKSKKKWLEEEMDLSDRFFKNRSKLIFHRIEDLCKFERYSYIRSSNNSFYFCGVERFSKNINIYKYIKENKDYQLIKTLELPYYPEYNINALVLQKENNIAIIGGLKGESNKIYIYNLKDDSKKPSKIIDNIINQPLNPTDNGFLFTTDNLSSEKESPGISSLYHCAYNEETFSLSIECIYTYESFNANKSFDSAFDYISGNAYIGAYDNGANNSYKIECINLESKKRKDLITLKSGDNEDLHLGGSDDVNLYIIGTNKKFRGTLYTIDKKTLQVDTVISNNVMPIKDFSLIKDHALIYFQGHASNRAYLINKHTKSIEEIPINDHYFYSFSRNKKSDIIYFKKESLVSPGEVKLKDINRLTKTENISNRSDLPYNPDEYVTEYITIKSESGNDVNLQLTYKKGVIRDGSNPLFLCSFINSEDSFLDKFYLSRVLYMDHGYIFAQRAKSDSKKEILLENRIKDIYSSIQYLIKEKYTSKDKIALFGKEYGATAIMQLLNKYDDIQAPTILMDGIYDLIKYNEKGRLLYNNERLVNVNDAQTFDKLIANSPYHNVVNKKNYPPILLMTSNENLYIPKSHTYKMTAKLQMRTKGYNPILMLNPERVNQLDEYSDYTYTVFIEHAFWFLSRNLGVAIE